jgi:putative transposase
VAFAGHSKTFLSDPERTKTAHISGAKPQEVCCVYPSDLTDEEWAIAAPFFGGRRCRGRPNRWPVRRVLNAVFYVLRSGCAWCLLPHDFPPWQTVFYYFSKRRLDDVWDRLHKVLRAAEQQRAGKLLRPPRAYDAAKKVFGRKRYPLVDAAGLMLATYVTPADVQDREGARRLLARLKPFDRRLELIWADGAYGGKDFERKVKAS